MTGTHVNLGVVGLGYWGKNLLRTFAKLPSARVTGLCDMDPTQIARFAADHPGARGTTDYAEFLHRDDVDAIVLATPPSRHHAMALAALRAGKHVWVEKPLALTTADARELVETAARAERRPAIGRCNGELRLAQVGARSIGIELTWVAHTQRAAHPDQCPESFSSNDLHLRIDGPSARARCVLGGVASTATLRP